MKRKSLMIATSIMTGLVGLVATFFPKEILNHMHVASSQTSILFVQITGALYLGFALMNWMAKTVLIGGIYARPLAMGNFAHFMIAAIAIVKVILNKPEMPYLWIVALGYSLFAISFAIVLFTNPGKKV